MEDTRRNFVKAIAAILSGIGIVSIGAAKTIFDFFFGSKLKEEEQAEIMKTRQGQMELNLKQSQLALERERNKLILIAPLSDLDETTGMYFIDFEMNPGMAFLGKDGKPNLISAKCTHLGCTVGNQVNSEGKVLCPCHLSYFDVATGNPDANSPAKAPLAHIPCVVQDGKVYIAKGTGESGT